MKRHTQLFTWIAALALTLVAVLPVYAQAPLPVKAVYAEQYNQWSFASQQANTYTFSGTTCQSFPLTDGQTPQYFVFGPTANPYPVFIQDALPANSEIVVPSSTSQVSSACGFSAAAQNQHASFYVRSGTAGLQDAVGSLTNSATTPIIVYLDRTWYSLVNGLPGSPTVQSIINALTGSTGVMIVDTTTAPFTSYTWNGTRYTASGAASGFPNLKVAAVSGTALTAITAPTALSTASTTTGAISTSASGGTLPASSTYRLAVTYVDASGGETLISTDSASTSTIATGTGSTNSITVTSPAAATGAVGYRLYMSAASGAAGSEILYSPTCGLAGTYAQQTLPQATVCAIGQPATVTAVITGTQIVPGIASAYPRTSGYSNAFPPFTAGGTLASAAVGTLAVINLPAGYLNAFNRSITVCGDGNIAANATPGTLALKAVLSSVYGVTSVTPITITSATTSGSAANIKFPFCFTLSTATIGASGTLWAHGYAFFDLTAAGTGTEAQDTNTAVSAAIDLTKADTLSITLTPTTVGGTAFQLTQLEIIPSN